HTGSRRRQTSATSVGVWWRAGTKEPPHSRDISAPPQTGRPHPDGHDPRRPARPCPIRRIVLGWSQARERHNGAARAIDPPEPEPRFPAVPTTAPGAQRVTIQFTKMHGIGNDYVYVSTFDQEPPADPAKLAVAMSDRHYGIGADGLILIMPSQRADARMRMFNADGSEGEMC